MNKNIITIILAIVISSCASVDFNNKNGVDDGFMYYPAKPFLLIEKKDNTIVSKIISIPDTENPKWIKQGEGWGSAEMSFEIENGMLKTFNSKSDNKGPEILTSIAGLATAKAALDTVDAGIKVATINAAKSKTASVFGFSGPPSEGDYYEIGLFKESAKELELKVLNILNNNSKEFESEIEILKENIYRLKDNIYIELKNNDLDKFVNDIEKKRGKSKSISDQLKIVLSTLDFYVSNKTDMPKLISPSKIAKNKLNEITNKLSAFSKHSSSITGLYQIEFFDKKLKLTKVIINVSR